MSEPKFSEQVISNLARALARKLEPSMNEASEPFAENCDTMANWLRSTALADFLEAAENAHSMLGEDSPWYVKARTRLLEGEKAT